MADKKYEILLPYNRKIVIDQEKKDKIDTFLGSGQSGRIKIGGEWIDPASIKGVFEAGRKTDEDQIHEEHMEEMKQNRTGIRREFFDKCREWQSQTPKEKADREIRKRMGSLLRLAGVKKGSQVVVDCYNSARWFFTVYPGYPWYPFDHWKHLVRDEVSKNRVSAHMADMIKRHDAQYLYWLQEERGADVVEYDVDDGFSEKVRMAEKIFGVS